MTTSNTPVSALTDDWPVKPLGELFIVSAGGDWDPDNCVKVRDSSHPYPVVANALTPGATQGYCSYYTIPGDTLTITGRGDVGRAVYRPEPFVPIVRLLALVPKRDLSPKFFVEYINTQVNFSLESTGVPQLTAPQVRPYLLVLPPAEEQRAIARILEATDDLIAALEQMIAKKQAIKQGMMQQLLTGRTRLPGFDDTWSDSIVGAVARVTGGGTPSTRVSAYWNGDIPWFTPAEIKPEGSGFVSSSARAITQVGLASSAATLLPAGSVLVTSRASIGNCAVAAVPVATNQGFASMIPRDCRSTWFLYYWVQQNRAELESRSAGSTFLEISAAKVAGIPLAEPSLREQQAIGEALRDADTELDALKSRLAKARAIKTGMMQQLLTGRVRLPLEVTS